MRPSFALLFDDTLRLKYIFVSSRGPFESAGQWRIKGGADWATARGPQHLGAPNPEVGKKCNM